MPLRKRVLYDPAAYHRKDVFEESTPDSFLQDHNMSKLLGTMNQLAYLSSFALEIFQNLAVLSEDLSERIKLSSVRTTVLFDSLRAVDREVSSIDDDSHIAAVSGLSAYLQIREMITPQLFNKSTNYNSITAQYRICRPPPQLWRIEVFTHEDCFRNYSNPGFFFQEWIRTEIVRQQIKKEEKKKNKVLRKQQRQERKKLKEEAEAAAAEEEDLFFPLQPSYLTGNQPGDDRNSSNVSLSGVTDKGKRNKSILSPNREEFRRKMQLEPEQRNATRRASPPRDNQQQQFQRDRENSFDQTAQEQSDAEEGSVRNIISTADKTKEKQKKKGLKGLSKLFKRSKKEKEHKSGGDSDELSDSEEETYQAQSNGPNNFGDRERERGASRDLAMSDSDEMALYPRKLSQSPPVSLTQAPLQSQAQYKQASSAQPMSYVDELTAATATSRRMSLSNNGHLSRHFGPASDPYHSTSHAHMHSLGAMTEHPYEDDNNLYENEASHMQIQAPHSNRSTAKRRKQAPVTMKIGSKFLSASSGGNSKAEKIVTSTVPDLSAQVKAEERENDAHGKKNDKNNHKTDRVRTLLRRPSSTPVPLSTTNTNAAAHNKASKTHKRQSFALSAHTMPGMFPDRRQGKESARSSDEEGGDMLSGSSLRRRSLLNMLQDEVLEGLNRAQEDFEDEEGEYVQQELELNEEEEEEEHYDEYGNPISVAGSRSPGKSVDILEDDVDPNDADTEHNVSGHSDEVDIIEEDDVITGENDGDDDFIDEQDAPEGEEEPSEEEEGSVGPEDGDEEDEEREELPSDEERDVEQEHEEEPEGRKDRKRVHSRPPPPPPPILTQNKHKPGPPGPPPPPAPPAPVPAPRSALSSSVLGSLQNGAFRESLKKVAPPPEPQVDDRVHLLRSIQLGSAQLKGAPSKAAAPFQKIAVQQNEAVAAILANRSKIAGSDTESSDDSDSDYTDDDY